jgi:protein TonB
MKSKLLLLSATVLGGLLSSATFAATSDSAVTPMRLEAPAPVQVVNPTGLQLKHEGATVDLAFTVDAKGKAHNIRVLSEHDTDLTNRLAAAVKQWQFKPATKNGTPVSINVIMPLQLI